MYSPTTLPKRHLSCCQGHPTTHPIACYPIPRGTASPSLALPSPSSHTQSWSDSPVIKSSGAWNDLALVLLPPARPGPAPRTTRQSLGRQRSHLSGRRGTWQEGQLRHCVGYNSSPENRRQPLTWWFSSAQDFLVLCVPGPVVGIRETAIKQTVILLMI